MRTKYNEYTNNETRQVINNLINPQVNTKEWKDIPTHHRAKLIKKHMNNNSNTIRRLNYKKSTQEGIISGIKWLKQNKTKKSSPNKRTSSLTPIRTSSYKPSFQRGLNTQSSLKALNKNQLELRKDAYKINEKELETRINNLLKLDRQVPVPSSTNLKKIKDLKIIIKKTLNKLEKEKQHIKGMKTRQNIYWGRTNSRARPTGNSRRTLNQTLKNIRRAHEKNSRSSVFR